MKKEMPIDEDPVRINLRRVAADKGKSLAKLSVALKKNRAYLAQFLETGSPKHLTYEQQIILAKELGVNLMAFNADTAAEWTKNPSQNLKSPKLAELEQRGQSLINQPIWSEVDLDSIEEIGMSNETLPLFGTVAAGPDTVLVNGIPQGTVDRPSSLKSTPGAYALRVTGDSMIPKYKPGDIIIVSPSKNIRPGHYVVVCLETDCGPVGLIKQFDKIEDDVLYLSQFKPRSDSEKPLQYNMKHVLHMHKVVSSIEGA